MALTKITGSGLGALTSDVEAQGSSGATLKLTSTDTTGADTELLGQIDFVSSDSSTGSAGTQARIKGVYEDNGDSSGLAFITGASTGSGTPTITERMRVDHNGNVLVGKTATTIATQGAQIDSIGRGFFTSDGSYCVLLNRLSSNGTVIKIHDDGTETGIIGVVANQPYFATPFGSDSGLRWGSNKIEPCTAAGADRDNVIDLGGSSVRFDDVRATNGTIQTSDQNEKQDIASLTTAEITAAKAISKLFKTFKWQDKVAAKGDAARTHAGVVAQEVQTAMSDAGLDASKYAFWCSDTWWESNGQTYETADDAPEGATQRTRLGVRYPELLAFIGAATEQRLVDIETRLTALEA